jgi:replicative DNA helicase
MNKSQNWLPKDLKALDDKSFLGFPEIALSVEKDMDSRSDKPDLPTGIQEVDDLIWGMHKKELLIIGARPSNGKTSLSLAICWNLVKLKIPCIYVSLEMSKENLVERIICQEYKISGWKLRKGFLEEKEKFFKVFPSFYEMVKPLPFMVIDYMGREIEEIEYLMEERKPVAMFIDHVQKISPMGYSSKYEALSDYVNKLQDLAIKNNCAVCLNSQINRQDNLKGSGDLEECADTFIQCKWKVKDDPDYSDKNEFEIQVMKQRHGACEWRSINFFADTYSFGSRESAWVPN